MVSKSSALLLCAQIVSLAAVSSFGFFVPRAQARVVSIVIDQRQIHDSQGTAGSYERLSGRAFGELDLKDPHNTIINDLEFAPRNARGKVEYVATFTIVKPLDLAKASGLMIYSIPNRGNRNLPFGGDTFFFDRGDMILYSGWQGDIRSGENIMVPIAKNPDNSSIIGRVLSRFIINSARTVTLTLPANQPSASMDTKGATLTMRATEDGEIIPLSPSDWSFADCRAIAFPGQADPTRISVKGGFEPGYLYELSYITKDPPVLGIGLAAMRDVVSFFRRAAEDDNHEPNPVKAAVTHVIAQGVSQAGNVVKTFIHLGFNQDESGQIVWDGANDHIAARQLPLNFRFAIPGGAASLYEPGSEGVLWWGEYQDTARGRKAASLLDRALASNVVPKVFETFGAAEFWGLRMSPGLVGTRADQDIPLPPNVRRFYFPGTTHGGGRGGFTSNARAGGNYALADNPNPQVETMRALMVALIDWVVKDIPPPSSKYPLLAEHQLVLPNHLSMGFPVIPGIPLPDNLINRVFDYDFGPDFNYNDMSGRISIQPPIIKQVIPSLVAKVDADGNEVSGLPSVLHQAPLGTYLGWNVMRNGFSKGRAAGFSGGYIPFAKTKAQRDSTGDPRLSLEERYHDHDAYVTLVKAAAERQVRERFLLPEDAQKIIREAEASDVLR